MPPSKFFRPQYFFNDVLLKQEILESRGLMNALVSRVILSLNHESLNTLLTLTDVKLSDHEDLKTLCCTIIPSPNAYNTLSLIFNNLKQELSPLDYNSFIESNGAYFAIIASQSSDDSIKNMKLLREYGVNFDITIQLPASSINTTPLKLAIVRKQEKVASWIAELSSEESLLTEVQGGLPMEYACCYKLTKLKKIIRSKTKHITTNIANNPMVPLEVQKVCKFVPETLNTHVAEFVSHINPSYGTLESYSAIIQNMVNSMSKTSTITPIRDVVVLSNIGYAALLKENGKVFDAIESYLKSPKFNSIKNLDLLTSLYNISFKKNNQMDNITRSATSLSKAISIIQDENIAKTLPLVCKTNTLYNMAMLYSRYHRFDEAIEARDEFSTLAPEDSDISLLDKELEQSLAAFRAYIPQLRMAARAKEILEQRNQFAKIQKIFKKSLCGLGFEREDVSENLLSDPSIVKDCKIWIQTLSDDFEGVILDIQKIYDLGDRVSASNLAHTWLTVSIVRNNPEEALKKLTILKQKLPKLLNEHNNMFLAKSEFLVYIQNDELTDSLKTLEKISTIWSKLTDVGFNTQYHAESIFDNTVKQYITLTLSREDYKMASKAIIYLPKNEQSKYQEIITLGKQRVKDSKAVSTVPIRDESAPKPLELNEDDTAASEVSTTKTVLALGFKTRLEKPVKSSPLSYSLAELSRMIDTSVIPLHNLTHKIQNIYFRYSSLLLNKHNMEMLNSQNLVFTWRVNEKQYIYNPSSANNSVYKITHHLYATIDYDVLDAQDPVTANQFTEAIKTSRITRELGQKGIKILSPDNYELKINADARMIGNTFENPAKKQLIVFDAVLDHKAVSRTHKNTVIKVNHLEAEVANVVEDRVFEVIEKEYFQLLGQLGEEALMGVVEFSEDLG